MSKHTNSKEPSNSRQKKTAAPSSKLQEQLGSHKNSDGAGTGGRVTRDSNKQKPTDIDRR